MQLQNLVETVREQLADPRRMSHGNIRHSLEAIVVSVETFGDKCIEVCSHAT